jgi:hypothetical protein
MSANAATCSTTNNVSASPEESLAYCLALVSSSATSTISSFDLNGPTEESFPFRDSLSVARKRLARSLSSATSSTDDSLSVLSTGDLPFRDSLEVARESIALKHERQRAAHSSASSAALSTEGDSADVSAAAGSTIGFALARGSDNVARPWAAHIAHKNSIDLPCERIIRTGVAERRARSLRLRNRVCAEVKARASDLAIDIGAKYAWAKAVCFHKGYMPEPDISVRGRSIKVYRNTGHKMVSSDYEAYERGLHRFEVIARLDRADAAGDGWDEWCRLAGLAPK